MSKPVNHDATCMCNVLALCDITYPTKCMNSCMNLSISSLTKTDMLNLKGGWGWGWGGTDSTYQHLFYAKYSVNDTVIRLEKIPKCALF